MQSTGRVREQQVWEGGIRARAAEGGGSREKDREGKIKAGRKGQ